MKHTSTNGDTQIPETAEPLSPYNILPFNDAIALVSRSIKRGERESFWFRWIGFPLLGVFAIIALLNANKAPDVRVKTITVYCYTHASLVKDGSPACDSTKVDASALLPVNQDFKEQEAIAEIDLPWIIRKCFEINGPQTTAEDIRDFCTPYLAPNSQAYNYFMKFYKDNPVVKLGVSQTNSVSVDPMTNPIAPNTWVLGYTIVATSNDATSNAVANHYLAQIAVKYDKPAGVNKDGLYIYSFAINNVKPVSITGASQ